MKYRPSSLKLSNVPTTYGHRQLQNLRALLRLQTMRIAELEDHLFLLEVVLQAALASLLLPKSPPSEAKKPSLH